MVKLKNAHCTYFEGQTGLCKAKEFTRCNPVNCKLYTIDELSTIVDLQEQLDQLKRKEQECEELKRDYFKQNEWLQEQKKELDQLKAENEHLSEKEEEAKHYLEEAYKFKQTLTEIKEIAETCSFTDSSTLLLSRIEQILQKISEVTND